MARIRRASNAAYRMRPKAIGTGGLHRVEPATPCLDQVDKPAWNKPLGPHGHLPVVTDEERRARHLTTVSGIAKRFGVSEHAVNAWAREPHRRFPEPVARLAQHGVLPRLWRAVEVEAWARTAPAQNIPSVRKATR